MAIKEAEWCRGDPVQFDIGGIQYKGVFADDKAIKGNAHIRITEIDGERQNNLTMLVSVEILTRA